MCANCSLNLYANAFACFPWDMSEWTAIFWRIPLKVRQTLESFHNFWAKTVRHRCRASEIQPQWILHMRFFFFFNSSGNVHSCGTHWHVHNKSSDDRWHTVLIKLFPQSHAHTRPQPCKFNLKFIVFKNIWSRQCD